MDEVWLVNSQTHIAVVIYIRHEQDRARQIFCIQGEGAFQTEIITEELQAGDSSCVNNQLIGGCRILILQWKGPLPY